MLTLDDDEWLLADIGGTYARFAHWRVATAAGAFQRLRNEHYADLAEAVSAFEAAAGAHAPRAALALATPILGDQLRLTNRDWQFSATALRAACAWGRLHIVNDFVAAAAGLPDLQDADRQLLQAGAMQRVGTTDTAGTAGTGGADGARRAIGTRPWLLLGPGTGLGSAVLLDAGAAAERVLASEAGHMSFAPADPRIDAPLQRAACERWERVSWERLLSGSGLAWLHAQLMQALQGNANAADAAAAIDAPEVVRRALAGEAIAQATVSRFCGWLGACAGDLCLAFGADGGVYLTGGVLNGLGAAFDAEAFLRAFRNKGRAGARLVQVPVWRLNCDDLAFRGLQRIVAGRVRAPGLCVDAGGLVELA